MTGNAEEWPLFTRHPAVTRAEDAPGLAALEVGFCAAAGEPARPAGLAQELEALADLIGADRVQVSQDLRVTGRLFGLYHVEEARRRLDGG